MIIGALHNPWAHSASTRGQVAENAERQPTPSRLAEDRVTLNGAADGFSATYERPVSARKTPERSLTQIAWDNLLAQRIGLSREKLDEIEQKKREIENSSELSDDKKQQLLADLDKEKEELIKEALERRQERGDEERQSNPDPATVI